MVKYYRNQPEEEMIDLFEMESQLFFNQTDDKDLIYDLTNGSTPEESVEEVSLPLEGNIKDLNRDPMDDQLYEDEESVRPGEESVSLD